MRTVANPASGGKRPGAPTIGTATAGNASATVAYTAPSYLGKGGTVTYTATSSPGGLTGTGASPITVSGLTNGTAYTFTVTATTSYGVTSAASAASNSVTPTVPKPTVTGGTLTSDSTYYYRSFTSSGSLTVSNANLTADVLIVAGGANGGAGIWQRDPCSGYALWLTGRGGGAGGLISSSGATITPSTLTVTVGAGGGGTGSNSSVTGFTTALGGGTGSGNGGYIYGNYSCGGYTRIAPGCGTSGQGNKGGSTVGINNATSSQGGGGAGAQGIDYATQSRPDGGVGSSAFSSWGSVTGLGQNVSGTYYFAGGGGGYSGLGGGAGLGGSGGGTNGTSSTSSSNSPANTGGGSGGVYVGSGSTTNISAGNGGSGVVIFRYTKAQVD